MRTLLILVATLLAFSSCEKKKTEFVPRDIEIETIAKGEVFTVVGNIPQELIVITNQNQFSEVIGLLYIYEYITETTIDFSVYRVIAVISETKNNNGGSIDITKIVENKDNITVTIQDSPASGDIPAFTRSFHFVKIENTVKPIIFSEIAGVKTLVKQ